MHETAYVQQHAQSLYYYNIICIITVAIFAY